MNRLFYGIVFLFLLCSASHAQNIDFILHKSPTEYTESFNPKKIKKNQLLVHLKHSSSKIEDPRVLDSLQFKVIYSIQLIYTEPDQKIYNQERLNRRRLEELNRVAPFLIENNLIQWSFVEQKKSETHDATKQFHGYLITLRPELSGKDGLTEFQVLEKLISENQSPCMLASGSGKDSITSLTEEEKESNLIEHARGDKPEYKGGQTAFYDYLRTKITYTPSMFKHALSGELNASFYINKNGNLSKLKVNKGLDSESRDMVHDALRNMPKWLPGVKWTSGANPQQYLVGGSFNISFFFSMEQKKVYIKYMYYQGAYYEKSLRETIAGYELPAEVLCDSTVFKTFERNKNWKKMSIIADLTGSMFPYTSQLITWFKLKTINDAVNNFTFFNDGDDTPDLYKKTGEVGGIYHCQANSYEGVLALAEKTMRYSGGDIMENNIEATLTAIENYPEADELVMIADNYATPRDLKLLHKVKKPIRLILCGTFYGINVKYLNLVRKNGGSIHTMENDLTNLVSMNEGEVLKFNGRKFKIVNGEFKEFYDL
ncbi:MAG: hypothetical protein KDD41_04815 [Flavobacteriales bacterium]|nr:hypothetical protein [Flavobacteriales bacterium]